MRKGRLRLSRRAMTAGPAAFPSEIRGVDDSPPLFGHTAADGAQLN
jgi:hypothetical protein